ncbi:MAG: hypothetical protein IIZ93_11175 [Acidaminococcaceae bacterium]|nr:hypothetical protein [Acidaminococcaceae bacterium]
METRKIVRANGAGVFFGSIESEEGDTVIMTNVRRIWYWSGAASLSELAQYGTSNPSECKFPCSVDKIKIFNVIEILDVTEKAAATIDGVPEWKKRN